MFPSVTKSCVHFDRIASAFLKMQKNGCRVVFLTATEIHDTLNSIVRWIFEHNCRVLNQDAHREWHLGHRQSRVAS